MESFDLSYDERRKKGELDPRQKRVSESNREKVVTALLRAYPRGRTTRSLTGDAGLTDQRPVRRHLKVLEQEGRAREERGFWRLASPSRKAEALVNSLWGMAGGEMDLTQVMEGFRILTEEVFEVSGSIVTAYLTKFGEVVSPARLAKARGSIARNELFLILFCIELYRYERERLPEDTSKALSFLGWMPDMSETGLTPEEKGWSPEETAAHLMPFIKHRELSREVAKPILKDAGLQRVFREIDNWLRRVAASVPFLNFLEAYRLLNVYKMWSSYGYNLFPWYEMIPP